MNDENSFNFDSGGKYIEPSSEKFTMKNHKLQK